MADKKELNVIQDHLKSLVSSNPQWKVSNENHNADLCSNTNTSDDSTDDACANLIPPVTIELTKNMGRQVVATRDIEAGELLLLESPLLSIVPQQGDRVVCVSCLQNLENDFPSCAGCGAPRCLAQCTARDDSTSDPHTPEECHIISHYGFREKLTVKEKLSMIRTLNALLTPLRVLKDIATSPQKAKLLWTFEDNVEKRKKIPNGLEKEYKMATLMQKQLRLDIETNRLLRIWGIYESNSFEVPLSDNQNHRGCALFSTVCMMNHSCIFNAQVAFFDGLAHVWATQNIPSGSPITINYAKLFLGNPKRRLALLKSKLFYCQCLRCTDPTELGSHLSSTKCPKCNTGLLIPPGDPENIPPEILYLLEKLNSKTSTVNRKESWSCSSCKKSVPVATIETLTSLTATFIDKVDKNNINCMKKTLSMMEQHLGAQNSTSVELRHNLVTRILREPLQELSSDVLWSVIDMSQSLLEVLNQIAPGKPFIRGHVLLGHARASSELLFRRHCDKDENNTESCPNENTKVCESSRFSQVILSERVMEPILYKERNVDEINISELLQQVQESRIILKGERSKPKDTRVLEVFLSKLLQKENEPRSICNDSEQAQKAELTNI